MRHFRGDKRRAARVDLIRRRGESDAQLGGRGGARRHVAREKRLLQFVDIRVIRSRSFEARTI